MNRLSSVLATCALAACATNPAKRLEPNGVDLKVNQTVQPIGLFRGDEQLDEQDFYELAGDTESFEAVRSSRSTGTVMQAGGASIVTVGVLTVAFSFLNGLFADGGVLGAQGLYRQGTFGGLTTYLLQGAGAIAILGGGGLFVWGGRKVTGQPPVFDLAHAQSAIERGRYGAAGLVPDNVASLALSTSDGIRSYCAYSGTTVKPLEARDKDGKEIPIQEHLDWVTVTGEPAGAVEAVDAFTGVTDKYVAEDDETVEGTFTKQAATKAPPKEYSVTSPLRSSLAGYGVPVTLTAKMKATSVSTTLTLEQNLDCRERVSFRGEQGDLGGSGQSGSSGTSSRGPSPGGNGRHGTDGARGGTVEAEAAWLRDPKGRRVALVAWTSSSSSGSMLVGPEGKVSLDADGGRGGGGGRGGKGGRGIDGSSKTCPTDGASGGSGGNGGRGGSGGSVRLRLSDAALGNVVAASADGGAGGAAGSRGSGGYGGSSSSGCQRSRSGSDGQEGQEGTPGQDGTVTTEVVAARELSLVAKALASMSGFALDGASDAPTREVKDSPDTDDTPAADPTPKKKKKGKKGKKGKK